MNTPFFDRLILNGTPGEVLRLADGHRLTLTTRAGSPDGVDEVYLWSGLDAPDGDGWELEDARELWLTAGDSGHDSGRLLYEVPVVDVRALIEEHGGEHADWTDPDA